MNARVVARSSAKTAWIRDFHPAPDASTALVCLPHAGGSATFYHPVSRAMSPHVDVLAIQYPGRQDRFGEPCVDDIQTLADHVTRALRPWTDRPLTLLGHSMGALVAFEVARRLEQEGVTALALFASGSRAPSLVGDARAGVADDATLIRDLQRLGGTDAALATDEALLRMVLPAMRCDYRAVARYRYVPGPPLRCPVTALTGDSDPLVRLDEAEAWKRHTAAAFHMRVLPGGHFFLMQHVAAVTGEIGDHIQAVAR